MTEMRCPQLREVAPDIALGLLTGEERADALAHLERCEACRAEIASLAGAADELLLAAPEASPPAGFDSRVLARLAAERADGEGLPAIPAAPSAGLRRRGRRRVVAAALAAAATVLLVVGGLVVGAARDDPAEVTAEMRLGSGLVVGEATATGDPVIITVDVPDWGRMVDRWGDSTGPGYWVSVELDDGSTTLEPVLTGGFTWTVPVDAEVEDLVAVSVLDDEGRVWCTGRFMT
jgi:hypothetical protein